MRNCNLNEAPPGHIAVVDERNEDSSCDGCSMYSAGFCQIKAPHSCCCLDRKDGCDVKFERKP